MKTVRFMWRYIQSWNSIWPSSGARNILRSYNTYQCVYFEQYIQPTEVEMIAISIEVLCCLTRIFFWWKQKKKKKRDIFLLKKKGSKNSIARVPSNIYMFYILLYVNILGRIVRRRIDAVRDGNPQHECTRWYQCYITVFISC